MSNMDLNINLKINIQEDNKVKKARAKAAAANKKAAEEVTESHWEKVLSMKNSKPDQVRLIEVRDAWRAGALKPQGKFSKAEALRMYKRLAESQREEKLTKMVENTPTNYVLIQNELEFHRMLKYLDNEPIIALDTETTGVDTFGDDEIVGLSLTLPNVDLHYYIPLAHDEGKQLPKGSVLARLKPYFESEDLLKVLHNAKFDFHVFKNEGIRVRGLAMDTMVAMWLLNENEMSYRLKDLATQYLKEPSDTFSELFGKNCKFNTVPLDLALVYAAKDTDITWRFYQWQLKHFGKEKLKKVFEIYNNIENKIVDVCFEMEQTGFVMDLGFAKEYGKELHEELEEVTAALAGTFGEGVNYNSPKQLQEIFYDRWELPDVSNKRSTDVDTLKILRDKTGNQGITKLLRYRELTKLIGTYVEKLPNEIKKDKRLHGSFKQMGTVTGRFSSNQPNLQNIPTQARKLFVAPEGNLIIGGDFSQIEPRVLAHISKDLQLREPYIKGQDLYSTLAARVFKLPKEQCGDGSKYRKMMKVGLLAVMYGTSMFTLAKQLGITVQEAEQFIEDFFDTYPDVAKFIAGVHSFVKKYEYVETMFGRKRRFPGHQERAIKYDKLAAEIKRRLGVDKLPSNIWRFKKELPYKLKREFQDIKGDVERVRRMAVNAIIQGSAADIMKLALINVCNLAIEKEWKILATVHDEVLLYVPKDITLQEVELIEAAMTGATELAVPMKVDIMITSRWGDNEKSKAEHFGLSK